MLWSTGDKFGIIISQMKLTDEEQRFAIVYEQSVMGAVETRGK
jgi:hypothetical protein